MSTQPFFIVGSGRSGSTLMRLILASHPDVSIPPETHFLIPLAKQFSAGHILSGNEVGQAIDIVTGHYRWPDLVIDRDEFRKAVYAIRNPTVRDIADVVYRTVVEREGTHFWGDKTPNYIKIVPYLAQMYPMAKFIHLVRDGRDVAKSFQSVGWYGRWIHTSATEWIEAADAFERWSETLSNPVLTIKYEDLVLDLEATVHRICKFLGLTFDYRMLAWETRIADQIPERERPIHEKLTRRPRVSDVARWKVDMSRLELLVCESFIVGRLIRLGYEPYYRAKGFRLVFPLVRAFCRVCEPVASFACRAYRYALRHGASLSGLLVRKIRRISSRESSRC